MANGDGKFRFYVVIKRAIARNPHLNVDIGFSHIGNADLWPISGRARARIKWIRNGPRVIGYTALSRRIDHARVALVIRYNPGSVMTERLRDLSKCVLRQNVRVAINVHHGRSPSYKRSLTNA